MVGDHQHTQSAGAANRAYALADDARTELVASAAVTDLLPNGGADIRGGSIPDEPDSGVVMVVRPAGVSSEPDGGGAQRAEVRLQVLVEMTAAFNESSDSLWLYRLFDEVAAVLDDLPSADARLALGESDGLGPEPDESRGRYIADRTFRFTALVDT